MAISDTPEITDGDRAYAASIARRMYIGMPPYVDLDDVLQDAMSGLCDAATRWEESFGIPLAQYASKRIAGAVYDAARRNDYLTRSMRAEGEDPGSPVHLDGTRREFKDESDVSEIATLRTTIADVLETLTSTERLIIYERFWEEKTLMEIGDMIGVTESRICQIVKATLNKLHRKLESAYA